MNKLSLLSVAWPLAMWPAVSWANEALVEVLEVQGRQVNLLGQAATASSGQISQQEIAVRPISRTGEILELVPGMVVTQHSGSGKANQFFLRGFNLDHGTDFATYLDGMPLNMTTHGHGQGYTDLNFIIPEAVAQLDYKKGAYYADVSDFSGAGSAHIYSANQTSGSTVNLTLGEFGYVRALYMDSFKTEQGNTLFAVERNEYDGPWQDINEDIGKTNLWLKYATEVAGGSLSAGLMAYKNSWNSADQIPQRAVEQGIISRLGSLDTTVGGESERYSANVNWSNGETSADAYLIKYSMNLWSNFTYFSENEDSGDQFEQVDDRVVYGVNLSHIVENNWLGLAGHNKFGTQIRVDNIDEVGLLNSQARSRTGTIRLDQVDQSSIGLYWDNEIEWNNRLRTVLGARYDYYDFDVQDLVGVNAAGVDLSRNSGTNSDDLISLKANVIYQIRDEWEGYVSWGQGFHSNDARGTTIQVDPASGDAVDRVDPLVRSTGYEVGVRGFIADKLNTSLSLWTLELDSELLFVGDAGNTEASGKSERYGVEFTSYYQLAENWTLDFEYAYTDAELVDAPHSENRIPGAIEQVVQLGVSLDQQQGWFGSLRHRYFGERPLTEDASVESGKSGIWNLRVGYHVNSNLTVSVDVLNLTDSDDHDIDYYYESRLATEPSGQVAEDVHFHPFEPRNIRASLIYTF